MEINQPLDSEISTIDVSSDSKSHLLGAAKWARFIAIAGFIFLGFVVLIFLVAGSVISTVGLDELDVGSMGGAIAFLNLVLSCVLIFFPNYYLYKFSSRIITAIPASSTIDLTDGLKNLKSVFKFYGIAFLFYIGFVVILFLLNFITL